MGASNYWKDRVCKHILREGAAMGANTGCFVSLHTADPGGTGASEVVVGGSSYTRQSVSGTGTFPTVVGDSVTNSAAAINFTLMPACTVTHVGLWDTIGPVTGNFLHGQSMTSKAVNAGDTFQFATSQLTIDYSGTRGYSSYLTIQLLKHLLLQATFGQPAALGVSLHTADPTESGASECSGGAGPYARQAPSFANLAGNSGAKLLNTVINYAGMPACTVNYIGIWDQIAVGGNFLLGQTVAALAKAVNAGDTFQIPGTGTGLTVTIS